jgi:phage tail sheath protein FI
MPVAVSYPGVYVEELPSGVHTITGVATSIAAFVGWAARGPVDKATLVLSWADYYRRFGGLDSRSKLGHAVSQFFMNGGQRAYIVRLARLPPPGPGPAPAGVAKIATLPIPPLVIDARSPGAWAKDYRIGIKQQVTIPPPPPEKQRFRLQVLYVNPNSTNEVEVVVESFENLSVNKDDPRFVTQVIENESELIHVAIQAPAGGAPLAPPANTQPPPPAAGVPSPKLQGGEDGTPLEPNSGDFEDAVVPQSESGGVYTLDRVDLFNLLCVPGETTPGVLSKLEAFCRKRRAFLIADCQEGDTEAHLRDPAQPTGITGDDAINAALYFPWVVAPDALQENRPRNFPPCGFVAGLYAKTDANRGVWKAPAGIEASLTGVAGLKETLTDDENGVLNQKAVTCLRTFNVYGTVIWGARTLRGNDEIGSEWKYIPVRRTALFIEESLYRGLKWVVFEPNDEPLWAQIRLNVGAFLRDLFRQGAFQGTTPRDAYFVKCDRETTTQNDINKGIVNILVGFAPLKPAEFVIIQIQQIAGQIQV